MTKARNIAEFADDLSVSNGEVSIADLKPSQSMMFRNKIINGDMRIDQRNAGSEVTFNSTFIFPVDRFRSGGIGPWSGSADIRAIQSTDAPAGFKNSLKIYTNSTAASAATDNYCLTQAIEGYQITDLDFGTSDAKSLTFSFYVKGTAGTYGLGFTVGNGMYITTYTVTSSWNRIVINIPANTTYSPESTTNSYGFNLLWDLGAGSNYETTTLNQWTAKVSKSRTSSCIQFGATAGAELFITGVQLEEGPVATPFEHRPYGLELSLCQRYYQVIRAFLCSKYSGTSSYMTFSPKVTMRANAPSGISISEHVSLSHRNAYGNSNTYLISDGTYGWNSGTERSFSTDGWIFHGANSTIPVDVLCYAPDTVLSFESEL